MKATLDIPDDLYRRVKARSAMEGRPVRSVAVQLFQHWLDGPPAPEAPLPPPGLTEAELAAAPWLAITRRTIKPGMSHDMDEIRAAIAKGWAAEAAEKYHKWVEWSDEDKTYIGKCPDLITGIHGDDPVRVYAELCEVVEDVLCHFEETGKPLPTCRTRPMMEMASA